MHGALLATVLVVGVAQQPDRDELPVLRVGETIEGEITDTAPEVHTATLDAIYATQAAMVGIVYRIVVEEAGAYHIDLRSYDYGQAELLLERALAICEARRSGSWQSRLYSHRSLGAHRLRRL